MLSRFMPKEGRFFDLFKQSGDLIVEGAKEWQRFVDDLGNAELHAKRIKAIEHQADDVTHKTIELLHTTFITPLDREDIHQLICKMDDILDFIEAAAERVFLYRITEASQHAKDLSRVILQSAEALRLAVESLDNMKNSEKILSHCVEINRLENEADHILRKAIASLFDNEPDTRKLIKHKELYELLETVTDRCEDVANIIEGIVLEYA